MRDAAEKIVTIGLAAVSWLLVTAGIILFFWEKTPMYSFVAYAIGIVLLFFNEYLSYDTWKRKLMSGEDAGQGAISGLLQMVMTGFVLPLALAGVFYMYVAKDGRVIIVLFMGYLAALIKLGFKAMKIFRAKDRPAE
jgi:Na+/phosphate symporter